MANSYDLATGRSAKTLLDRRRLWLSALLLAVVPSCSDGSGEQQTDGAAGGPGTDSGTGGDSIGGGSPGSDGASTGGASSGGALIATGGTVVGTGGAVVGTGGAVVGTGGAGASTGGDPGSGGTGTGGFGIGGEWATGGTGIGGDPGSGGTGTGGDPGSGGSGTGGDPGSGGFGIGGEWATGGTGIGGAGGAETGGASGEVVGTGGAGAETFHVFLLIGQSNMVGGAQTEPQDLVEDERIVVLGYDDCAQTGRVYNEWDVASPPLHACWSNGIGPGDHFAKTLIEALPDGNTIGLVPCGISGVDIDFFRKGVISARRDEFVIPPDDHWDGAYEWVMERAQLAQAAGGVIDGIIFHQGESDSGQVVWIDKVKEMVEDLRVDLGMGETPFIAGELLYGGACEGHNVIVNQLPDNISNTYVVSAAGLNGVDQYHFDSAGVRTIGQRYGEAMIGALGLSP